jgi:hypothetical protein
VKTFIEFEVVFAKEDMVVDGVHYSIDNLHALDGHAFDAYAHFGTANRVTTGHLYWDEEKELLFSRMWLESIDLDKFDKEIFSGRIVPVNVKFTPDRVSSEVVKNGVSE